ncbi:MAG TPA: alpha/beta family hydrolase, partial [Gaiellaceae bacterium]|nr:alpha/beta family hydrolase [Gaiellaceae bacterium]
MDTPHGPARVHLRPVEAPRAALVLGHGAGGGVAARDLVAATEAALAVDVSVALVEQPYRVAGRRSPAPARQLDAAWATVVERLRGEELRGLPLVVGGRSAGARVACRTVAATGAVGVLCLAFPLQPRRRSGPSPP